MSSDEGLNAYGAVTWGQFFVYQGFNDRAGWMHTSSNVDAIDEFVDNVLPPIKGNSPVGEFAYRYGATNRPFTRKSITLTYATPTGPKTRTLTAYFDYRGPIILSENGKWVSIELMNTPIKALEQSYLRTKARNYTEYKKTMESSPTPPTTPSLPTPTATSLIGTATSFPVATQNLISPSQLTAPTQPRWHGLLSLDEVPHLYNPKAGWLFNVNNAPWWGSGENSLKKSDFPAYVEQGGESSRGIHAIRLLNGKHDFTPDSLLSLAFDSYLPWFARTIPELLKAYDALPANDPQRAALKAQIALLRAWDFRWGYDSVATSLAVYWGETVGMPVAGPPAAPNALGGFRRRSRHIHGYARRSRKASDKLTADFGTWQVKWGDINRFQRINDDIAPNFSDSAPSIPVRYLIRLGITRIVLGTRLSQHQKALWILRQQLCRRCRVRRQGPRTRSHRRRRERRSRQQHFNDEAERYATGNFREVYFYPDHSKPTPNAPTTPANSPLRMLYFPLD